MKKEYIEFIGYTVPEKTDIEDDFTLKSLNATSSFYKVSEELIGKNLKKFISLMNRVLKDADIENDAYQIDEIDLNLDVNLEGSIKIISGGIKSGISIKLKKIKD